MIPNRKVAYRTFATAAVLFIPIMVFGQSGPTASTADPQISAALKQVSADKIQKNIEKLVSFGTRSTLSAGDLNALTKGRGIDAARLWIVSEF